MGRNYLLPCVIAIAIYFVGNTFGNEAIINGAKAGATQFPYNILVQTQRIKCGGGIIGEQFVLTAAHCVLEINGEFRKDHFSVLAGTNDRSKTRLPAVSIDVEKIYVSNDFQPPFIINPADMAVLKLKRPLIFSKSIQKLHLPPKNYEIQAGDIVQIAGFGWHWYLVEEGRVSGGFDDMQLRYANAEILEHDNQACSVNTNPKKQICARVIQRHPNYPSGICNGDSGGILVHNKNIAIGVLAKGPPNCTEVVKASTYSRISHYLGFVEDAIHDRKNDNIRVRVL